MSGEKQEYRVVSKRVGRVEQRRIYQTRFAAERRFCICRARKVRELEYVKLQVRNVSEWKDA